MRRKLNLRLFLTTLVVVLVFAGLFHAVHVIQVNRNVSSLLAYAREAKGQKKVDTALDLYAQYLRMVPGDLDVTEEYALTLDGIARGPSDQFRVVSLLEPLLVKSGNRVHARARLIDNLAAIGRYEAAARHIEVLLPTSSHKADLQHKLGWCLDAQGKHEAAAKAYRDALDLDPSRIRTAVLLAEVLHMRLGREEEAAQVLAQLVEKNPRSYEAFLARFEHQRLMGRDTAAAADLAEARRLAPREARVFLAASRWAQAQKDFTQARALVEEGIQLFPDHVDMIKELANLELRAGHRERALEVVEKGLKALGDRVQAVELQIFLADLLIDTERIDQAREKVKRLRAQGYTAAPLDFLDARLAVEARRWNDALTLLEKARSALASDPYWNTRVHALLGQCLGQVGDVERQVHALTEAVRTDPNWMALNLSLAQAHLRNGQPDQALPYLELAGAEPEAPPTLKLLEARALFLSTQRLPARRRDWRKVDEALAAAALATPFAVERTLLECDVLLARKGAGAARIFLSDAVKARREKPRPEHVAIWTAFADLETNERNHARALAILDDAVKLFGDRSQIRLSRMRVLASRGLQADRDQLPALVAELESFAAEERGMLLRELGEIWLRLGDLPAAGAALRRAAEEQSRDPRSRAALLDLALQENNLDQARHWLKELQTAEGSQPRVAPFAEVRIRIEEAAGRRDVLVKILKDLDAGAFRTDAGRRALLVATLQDRLGAPEQVLAALREAVKAGVRAPRPIQLLVRMLTERQRFEEAGEVLALVEASGPLPRELWRPAVEVALLGKDADRVRDLLAGTELEAVRDYRELVWLGRVYFGIEDKQRARAALRRAIDLAPHSPDAWVAYLQTCVQAEERDLARKLLAELPKKVPAPRLSFLLARCWEALGDWGEADKAYRAALAERPTDFVILLACADFHRECDQPAQAEKHYRKILEDAEVPALPEVQARARRGLALVWSEQDPARARALLANNLSRAEASDQRLDLFLEGLDPAQQRDALRKLEAELAKGTATADERFRLALLHERAGDSDRYQAVVGQILADRQETPQMLAHFVRHLLRKGDRAEAAMLLERLQLREPTAPRTRDLLALLAKQ